MHKDIISNNELIAQVYDLNDIEGVSFPTPETATFQYGFGKINEDKVLVPHIHKRVKREINTTSEFLYVVKGEMIIDILNEKGAFIEKVILLDNMALLQFIGGHKIEIKAETKYFELKQGPYYGREFDKFDVKF